MQRYNPMTKCLETVKTTDSIYSDMHNKINKYNANAVMYDILEDARLSKDKKEVKRCIQECKQIIKKFPYREDQSVSSSTITSKLKFAENKLKTMDRKTVDRIPVKKVLKALKSKLNVYYIIEDTDGRYWVTTKKDGSGGGTLEFSMSNAIKTAQNYIKMDELNAKYGKEEGYKKWMRGEDDRKTVDAKTFYYVTYYVMGRGKETKYFDNPNDAMKFYNKADRADKPKKLTYSNPQKIKELEEYIREQNAYSRYY